MPSTSTSRDINDNKKSPENRGPEKKSTGSHTGAAGYDNDALRGQRIGMGGHFLIQVISPQSGTADEIPGDLFRKISDLQSTGGKICKKKFSCVTKHNPYSFLCKRQTAVLKTEHMCP